MRKRFYPILFISALLVGCSSGKSQDPPALIGTPVVEVPQKTGTGQVLQGTINGEEWVFQSGRAFFKRSQPNLLVLQLWDIPVAQPCKEKTGSALQMRITAPHELLSWTITPEDPFNAVLSIFFVDRNLRLKPRDNVRADHGEITFLSIDKNQVSGVLAGSFQNPRVGGTQVLGDFSVPICR